MWSLRWKSTTTEIIITIRMQILKTIRICYTKKRIFFNTILSPTCFGVTKNSLLDHFLIKKFGNNLKKLYHWIWIFWPYSNLLILCLQKSDTKMSKHRINNESFQNNYPVLNENIQSFDWSPIYRHYSGIWHLYWNYLLYTHV